MIKREEGQAAVEFALVLPILLLIICGILDFGWLFYNQLSLNNSCREGARLACVSSTSTDIETDVKNKINESLPANLISSEIVTVTFSDTANPISGDVTVSIEAEMPTITPVLGAYYGKTKTLTYSVVMKMES